MMTWIDGTILFILLLSAFLGWKRGMMKELVALATWIAAIVLSRTFAPQINTMLEPYFHTEPLRTLVSFILVIALVVMAGSLVKRAAGALVSASGLSGADRFGGLIFGTVRGAVILAVLVAVLGLTPVTEELWWQQSQALPLLEVLRDQLAGLIDQQLR